MVINIFNKYGNIKFDYEKIVSDITKVFSEVERKKKCISLILINNNEIHAMNKKYRELDYPTDVLSFPEIEEDYMGEIFVSVDKVYSQAKEYDHSNEREFAFLLTHGVLHLLGYDHLESEDEKRMFTKQEEILNQTNYRRDKNG